MANETFNTLANSTNIAEVTQQLNALSGGALLGIIIFMQWFIIFLMFRNWDTTMVMVINSFVSMLLTFILGVALGWVGISWFIASTGAFVIFASVYAWKKF